MGAEENKQVVKDLYATFGGRDMAAVAALVAKDVIWHLPGTVPHYSGTHKGPSSIVEFFQELSRSLEIQAFEPCEFVAEAHRVLVSGWSRGRVKSTGRMFDNRWVMAFSVCGVKSRNSKSTRHPSSRRRPRCKLPRACTRAPNHVT